jgi:hypothetical protein
MDVIAAKLRQVRGKIAFCRIPREFEATAVTVVAKSLKTLMPDRA